MEFAPANPIKRDIIDDVIIEDISENIDLINTDSKSDNALFSPPPRAKTRLLSRSLSVSDLSGTDYLMMEIEQARRNSSGEYNQNSLPQTPPSSQTKLNQLSLTCLNGKLNHQNTFEENITNSTNNNNTMITIITPPTNQLTPINLQFQNHSPWKPPAKHVAPQEDTFTVLLQTTAERVLNRLKSRQQDLGKNISANRKLKKHPLGVLQPVPRKLQPISRDTGKLTPHSRSNSTYDESKSDCENTSLFNL